MLAANARPTAHSHKYFLFGFSSCKMDTAGIFWFYKVGEIMVTEVENPRAGILIAVLGPCFLICVTGSVATLFRELFPHL